MQMQRNERTLQRTSTVQRGQMRMRVHGPFERGRVQFSKEHGLEFAEMPMQLR